MKTIEERAIEASKNKDCPSQFENGYWQGATEQKAIDIETIPQLYVRWLLIEGDKPSWEEYANKAMGE